VEADEKAPSFLEQRIVALNTINDFVTAMKKNTEYKAKTIRTYAGAVQALVKYLIPGAMISTRYADFSGSREARRQYPWTVQTVSMFVDAMNEPLYRCLVAVFFQSGVTISDVLALTYGDVKKEFEAETMQLCLDMGRTKKDAPYMTFMGSLSFLLLKQYLSCRGALSTKDPLFPINKSSVERIFLRRAKKLPRIFDQGCLFGPQSLRVGFRTAMQDSGTQATILGVLHGNQSIQHKEVLQIEKQGRMASRIRKTRRLSHVPVTKPESEWRCPNKSRTSNGKNY